MRRRTPARHACQRDDRGRHDRDRGVTLIEILVAIVLLGTVIAATLTTLRVTVSASALDRDHSNAHAWLQTAADMLYARELITCDSTDKDTMISEYQATIQATDNPEDWSPSNIEVIGLEFWSIDIDSNGVGTEAWGATCDAGDTNLQKLELRVTAEDGRIVEEVEVIIGG